MPSTGLAVSDFDRYLDILEVSKREPDIDFLNELVLSQFSHVPFENISKLFYWKTKQVNQLMDFNQYITGIEQFHFGGTCYTTNYYFFQLLRHLGFNVKLCGADMTAPDVHVVIIANLEGLEFLVDVGYGAPFLRPLPCDLNDEYVVVMGNDKYVLKPKNNSDWQKLVQYKNDEICHGYSINPRSRDISEFSQIIEDSFLPHSTFMNSILLTKFDGAGFHTVRNSTYHEYNGNSVVEENMISETELVAKINQAFGIPDDVVFTAIEGMSIFNPH